LNKQRTVATSLHHPPSFAMVGALGGRLVEYRIFLCVSLPALAIAAGTINAYNDICSLFF